MVLEIASPAAHECKPPHVDETGMPRQIARPLRPAMTGKTGRRADDPAMH
jgi:hypothetical protein